MYKFEHFGVELKQCNLENRSHLFLFKKQGAPLYIRASINAGTRWNTIPGISHFVEHILVAGSKKFPSKDLLVRRVEEVGGMLSASTGFDTVSVNVEIAQKKDLHIAIEILNEMLCNSLFDPKTIESERGAILSELRSKKSNPKSYISDFFSSLAFQRTYMEMPTLGNEESIMKIKTDDIKKFYDDYFSPDRITYIACGDVELEELRESLESSIKLSGAIKNSLPQNPQAIHSQSIRAEYFPNEQTHLTFGFRTDTSSLEEKVALSIINNILAVGRASILMTELRYKKGLVYGINGFTWFLSGVGMFGISTSCSEKNVQETIDILSGELNRIYENGFSKESFDFTKTKMLKSKFIEMETAYAWVNANDRYLNTLCNEKSNVVDLMNITEGISLQRVNEVFKKYIKPNSFYLAICGKNSADSLRVQY